MAAAANLLALIAATLIVVLLSLLAASAHYGGGGASTTLRVARAFGIPPRAVARFAFWIQVAPYRGWPILIAGGAHTLNELKQAKLDAQARLNALMDERDGKRSALADLLTKQAKGSLAKDEEPKLAEAESAMSGYDARISASRKLVQVAEQDLVAAEERAEREKVEAKKKPSPAAADAPNFTKDPRKGFKSHREFMVEVIKAGKRSSTADERLRFLSQRDAEDEGADGEAAFLLPEAFTPVSLRGGYKATVGSDEQGAYDDRYGGIAVGRTMLPGVLQLGFEGDPTAGRTQAIPMATPMVDMIARTDKDHTSSVSGGFTVTRKPEAASASSTRATMEAVTLKASSLFGLAYATEEILADSPISFVAVIEAGFRDQFAHQILSEKLRGKGGNEYLGVLTALAASGLGPTVSVAKETGQAAATILALNAIRMRARCWGYSNAVWIANHDTYPQLATLSIAIGVAGQLVYQQSTVEDRPDTLLGRPIFYSEYPSTLGTQGDLVLGNWSQYLEGLYQPLQSAESIHVRFVNHERTFKLWQRNAAAPWWKSALTPNKGANTLSPWVVLDNR